MDIMHVHGVLDGVPAQFVSPSITQAFLEASARHPAGKTPVMMAAANPNFSICLLEGGTAKLRGPHNQCFLEHATGLEVRDQSSDALVGAGGIGPMIPDQTTPVAMSVP